MANISGTLTTRMEERLAAVFQAIPPRKEFINTLAYHIRSAPPAAARRISDLKSILVILAAVFSMLTLIYVGGRALFTLLGGRRRAQQTE